MLLSLNIVGQAKSDNPDNLPSFSTYSLVGFLAPSHFDSSVSGEVRALLISFPVFLSPLLPLCSSLSMLAN